MGAMDRSLIGEAAAAEREARAAWELAEAIDTHDTWHAAAQAAREALEAARRVEWPLVIEASQQAERLALERAAARQS